SFSIILPACFILLSLSLHDALPISNASEKFSNTPTDGEDICISPACVLSTISLSPPSCPSGYISTVILPSDLSSTSSWNFSYMRSEEHTSELQSRFDLVCRLLLAQK